MKSGLECSVSKDGKANVAGKPLLSAIMSHNNPVRAFG
jgi:hypothetical protein